ncbi:two-component system [Salinisphaera dokdonensis CL-ES53]|uniref:Two-component system n=1 Tax=Salinisphaera dokdonensis CL-ES53 TaxID=1304272 RepID=A0ABV2B381_9GAMM
MTAHQILIVDDEPGNLAALRQILAHDHALIFAANGTEALTACRRHQPKLVLLDIEMPGISGYSVCEQLKRDELTRDIPVIFVTHMSDAGNEAAGFASGAVDYITKPLSPAIVRARVRTHLSLVQASQLDRAYRDALFMFGDAGHYHDPDSGLHIWRMASYTAALARACGWNADDVHLLELAATLHDTGKIGIPNAILSKSGRLTDSEWQIMQTHSRIGYDILAHGSGPMFRMAAEIALYHHEKWDGTGYPVGLSGEAIPECARLTAVADVFDALTTVRPYKPAWPVEDAVQTLIESAGSHFEPRVIERFLNILPEIRRIKDECDAQEAVEQAP